MRQTQQLKNFKNVEIRSRCELTIIDKGTTKENHFVEILIFCPKKFLVFQFV